MRSLSIAIGLCWFSFAAFGQTGFGSLSGSVYQGDHAPLANIPVEAKNVATGTFYKTTTSPQGDYKFERLPAGGGDGPEAAPLPSRLTWRSPAKLAVGSPLATRGPAVPAIFGLLACPGRAPFPATALTVASRDAPHQLASCSWETEARARSRLRCLRRSVR